MLDRSKAPRGIPPLRFLVYRLPRTRVLGVDTRSNGIRNARKCRAEGIADGLEDVAAVRFHRSSKELIVPLESFGHRRSLLLPTFRAALDVREQKRHRAGRQNVRIGAC
jgi:hypothetical protein